MHVANLGNRRLAKGLYGRLSTIIEDAVATDEYTVELHLTQPYYNTLRELCLANPFGIVSSEQFNEDLTAKQESFRSATYGTGPYMYTGDSPGFSPHEKLPSRRQLLSLGIEPRHKR